MSPYELAQAPLSELEARRLTERIRVALDRVSTAWADLGERITEAYQRRADLALGYGSWAEYAEAELKPSEGLAAEVRRQLVGMLSQAGMSTRAIAPTVGVGTTQVHRDRQVFPNGTPDPKPEPHVVRADKWSDGSTQKVFSDGSHGAVEPPAHIDPETGEVHESPHFQVVTGLDGKTYRRPEPSVEPKPKRRALPDQFFDAAYDLNRRVESVHRLVEDDRFPQNAEKIAQKHLSDLLQSRDLLQQVINQLS